MSTCIQINDKKLLKALLALRSRIETDKQKKNYNKSEMVVMESAYDEITGRQLPSGCGSCTILFTILNNWFEGHYDKTPHNQPRKALQPIKKKYPAHKPEVLEENKEQLETAVEEVSNDLTLMSFHDLKKLCKKKEIPYTNKIKKVDLIKLLS
jgi:hypothetical protein